MRILIVDDDDDIREVVFLSLTVLGGMEVLQASSGADAIAIAEKESLDAILLDVMMPTMDGPTTLAALRAGAATARIPVVFLTAKAQQTEIDRLSALGAAGVLTKPFDPTQLAAQIRNLLKRA